MLRKLVGYAAYFAGATSLIRLLTFSVGMLGAKLKSRETFGDYNTYVLIYSYAQGFFIFGINQTIQRYAAGDETNRRRFAYLAYLLFAVLFVSTGFAGVGVGVLYDWSYSFAMFAIPWIVLWWWARYLYRSTLDAKGETKLTVLSSLGNSVFTLGFIALTDFEDSLIYGDFAAIAVAGIVAFAIIPRSVGLSFGELFRTEIPKGFLEEMFSFTRPIWAAGQVQTLGIQAQGFWTRGHLGAAMMGTYGFMNQLWHFAFIPMDVIGQAALPGLVQAKGERSKLYNELIRLCLVAFPLIAISVAAGIPLVLQILDWAFALVTERQSFLVKYPELPAMMILMSLSVPMRAVEIVANQYAISEGYKRAPLIVQIVSLTAMAISLYPLTMEYGIYGVILAGGVAEVAKAVAFIAVLWKRLRDNMRTTAVWAIFSTIGVGAAVVPVYMYQGHPSSWLAAFPAAAIYVVAMFVFRMITFNDFVRVVSAYRARKSGA